MNCNLKNKIKDKLTKKKLIIFDYDGTLADTNILHSNAFKYALNGYQVDFEYSTIAGLKTFDALKQCLERYEIKISNDEICNLVKKKQQHFKSFFTQRIKLQIVYSYE